MPIQDLESSQVNAALDLVDQLKTEIADLKAGYKKLEDEYNSVCEEKRSVEAKYQIIIHDCKDQLKAKSKEFDLLKGQMLTTKDIELVQMKIVDEIEASKKKKWTVMQQDVGKYRNMYLMIRHELESLKTEIEKERQDGDILLKETRRQWQNEVAELEIELRKVKNAAYESPLDTQRIREIVREKNELSVKRKDLLSELENVRAEKSEILADSERKQRLLERRVSEQIIFAKTLASEKDTLADKVTRLSNELQNYLSIQEQLTEENSRLNKELTNVNLRYEEAVHRFNVDCSDMRMTFMKEKSQWEQEKVGLQRSWGRTKCELADANAQLLDFKQRCDVLEREYMEKVKTVQEEEWSKLRILEVEKHDLEKQLGEWKSKYAVEITKLTNEKIEGEKDLVQLQEKYSSMESHQLKDTLAHQKTVEKLAEAEKIVMELRNKVFEVESKFQVEAERCIKIESELRDKVVEAESRVSSLQFEVTQVQAKWIEEKASSERKSHDLQLLRGKIKSLEKLKSEWTTQLDATTESAEKSKKHYKAKISDYKTQVANLSSALASLQSEHELLKNEKTRRDAENQKRQQEFMSFLKHEGVMLA